jgi:NTP pyrophosphatase (non-canonical NTP hydrolase)
MKILFLFASLFASTHALSMEDEGEQAEFAVMCDTETVEGARSMNDTKTTLNDLKLLMKKVVDERDWNQFHSPKNLSMNIATEAAELMEKFLWVEDGKAAFKELETNRQDIEDECADVLIALISFANACKIDLSSAYAAKLENLKKKYPVEKSKGKSTKYTKL